MWFVPSLFLFGAVALSFGAEAVDRHVIEVDDAWYLFRGGPEGARSVLSVVASSMMTFTGVVFSVTVLVLQLASSQFSPRVLRTFLRDRGSQVALGTFIGTFVYALLGLRVVRGATDGVEQYVPALTVWVAVVLAAICAGTFVYFLHHVAQSIRAVSVLDRIGDEARERVSSLFPDGIGKDVQEEPAHQRPERLPSLIVPLPGKSGVVISVAAEQLWELLCKADVTVALVPMVGDFVAHGSPLFEVWGDVDELDVDELLSTVDVGRERTVRQDVAFAIRELVDVAERALSPGVNDPTTAVQAIDQIHDLLRRLVSRRFPASARLDDNGKVRLIVPTPGWTSFVRLGVDEIRQCGEGSVQVSRRLRFMLEDLLTVAPPFRSAELERQLVLLVRSVERGFPDEADEAVANRASAQGHGPH